MDPLELLLGGIAPKDDNEEMSPEMAFKAISMIFADPEEDDKEHKAHFSPQARIILLTILLCCTVLGMYTIFESFLDTIILAVLSGTHQNRLRHRLREIEGEVRDFHEEDRTEIEQQITGCHNCGILVLWAHHYAASLDQS